MYKRLLNLVCQWWEPPVDYSVVT